MKTEKRYLREDKISIIVAVYNIEAYIARCIESLVKQSFENLEILLIDDGSTDDSGKICRMYAEKDSRICYFCKENGGLSDARNYGMEKASGNWISFVDGDDYVHPEMYRILYEGVHKADVKLGICSFQTFDDGKQPEERAEIGEGKVWKAEDIIRLLFTDRRTDIVISCCKLYHHSLMCGFRFPEGRYREDEFSTYRFWFQVDRVFYTQQKLYYYYQRADSILHQKNSKKETDYYDALIERHEFFRQKKVPEEILKEDAFFCMTQLYNACFLEDGREQKKYYIAQYKRMYDLSKSGRKKIQYTIARYMTDILTGLWKLKKRRGEKG